MDLKTIENPAPQTCNGTKPWQSSSAERILELIDALDKEVKKSFDVLDNGALQAMSSRLGRVQEALHSEQEFRQLPPAAGPKATAQEGDVKLPTRVRLNVGGRVFATPLSALTSITGTFFDSMFGGESS